MSLSRKPLLKSIGLTLIYTMTSKLLPTPDADMGARGAAKQHKGHRASGAVEQKKLNDLEALMSSQEDSPASLFPKQEPDEVRKIVAISSRGGR